MKSDLFINLNADGKPEGKPFPLPYMGEKEAFVTEWNETQTPKIAPVK